MRAEPVAALFETGKVFLVGRFPELEDEMCAMTTAGYTGSKSPNRLDAMVWAVTSLFPRVIQQARSEEATRGGLVGTHTSTVRVNVGHSAKKRLWKR